MSDATSRLLHEAETLSATRRATERVLDYDRVAELFRRLTDLDSRSIGPELARLQNTARTPPPQPMTLAGKMRGLFFRMANPLLGRVLRAASLASPTQVAYQLALQIQEQQFESESKLRAEIADLRDRIEALERHVRSRRLPA